MKSDPPSPGGEAPRPTGLKKGSPAWWAISLALHIVVLGALFVIFPYEEFVKPAERKKIQQPLVNQKVLEATTKRVEEKQAEEMARKLREIEAITTDIQSVEVNQRKAHAAFKTVITQLSPELATDLATVARTRMEEFLAKKSINDEAWSAYEASGSAESTIPENPTDLKTALSANSELLKKVFGSREALNRAQAAVLEAQQQVAGRLGFLKDQKPELVARQTALVASWGKSMDVSGTHFSGMKPLSQNYSDTARVVDSVNNARRDLERREKDVRSTQGAIDKRAAEISKRQEAMDKVAADLKAVDPSDKRRTGELTRKISGLKKEIERITGQQTRDESTLAKRTEAKTVAQSALASRTEALRKSLSEMTEARKAITTSRKEAIDLTAEAVRLQQALDADLTESLAQLPPPPPPETAPAQPEDSQ